METLPPLISQEESDRKRAAPVNLVPSIEPTADLSSDQNESSTEPPKKKTRLRSKKDADNISFITPVKPKTEVQESDTKSEENDKERDSPGAKFVCKICSVCKRTKELIEKHCLENHGKVKVYAQVTRRKQRFRAKKSLITDEYEEELKKLTMWYCAYCEYEDNSQNGLKAHLSKGFHNAEDLHERSVNVFGNVAPFKCIVCFARFISSDLLRIHTATHTGKELLDRCIDFSTTMTDHDKDAKEVTRSPIKSPIIVKMAAKKGLGGGPGMGITMEQLMASGMLQVIETDSESDSDEDEDRTPKDAGKEDSEEDALPLSQLSVSSSSANAEEEEDEIPSEDLINFSFDSDFKQKKPPYKKPELKPGLKCFICSNILANDEERIKHLKENHKIEMNIDLLSFNFQNARRQMEEIDISTPEGKLVRKISNTKKDGLGPKLRGAINTDGKGRNTLKGRTNLKCQFCDRIFPNYESELFEKHEKIHKETFESPLNLTVPADWLKTNNNTQSLPVEPEIPF